MQEDTEKKNKTKNLPTENWDELPSSLEFLCLGVVMENSLVKSFNKLSVHFPL